MDKEEDKKDEILGDLPRKVIIEAKSRQGAGVKLTNHLTLAEDRSKIEKIVQEEIALILNDLPREQWPDFKLKDKQKKEIRTRIETTIKKYDNAEAKKLKSLGSALIREWQEYIQNAGTLKHLEQKFTDLKESIKLNKLGQSPEEKAN